MYLGKVIGRVVASVKDGALEGKKLLLVRRLPNGPAVVAIDAVGAGAEGLRVTLVRNGAVLNAWAGDTSVRATHREIFEGRPLVFRIDARARVPHRLVTNPIFVAGP